MEVDAQRTMKRRGREASVSALFFLSVLVGACHRNQGAEAYGDPVGVSVEASRGVPPFDLALAFTRGVSASAVVAPLTGALHQAIEACPALWTGPASVRDGAASGPEPGVVTRLAFRIEQGRIVAPPATGSAEPPEICLAHALDGRIVDAGGSMRVLSEVRFSGKASP
jgi:hypothetical protein